MAAVVVRLRQQVEPAEVALVLPPLVVVEAAVAAALLPLLVEAAAVALLPLPAKAARLLQPGAAVVVVVLRPPQEAAEAVRRLRPVRADLPSASLAKRVWSEQPQAPAAS
jgi:hypothetical protein